MSLKELGMLRATSAVSSLVGQPPVGPWDEAAWRDLHGRYYTTVRSFLRRMGVRHQTLDDVCQDVFLEMFRYLPRFRGDASLKTWLYRLCITQARRDARRRRVREAIRSFLPLEETAEADHSPLDEHTAARVVQRALGMLNEGERAVFVMFELEGASGREIAAALDCPEPSVWRRLHYARKKFELSVKSQERMP